MGGLWNQNFYAMAGTGKYHRVEYPTSSRNEDGQWTITGTRSEDEDRDFLEKVPTGSQ
jgi:hypothetical protein